MQGRFLELILVAESTPNRPPNRPPRARTVDTWVGGCVGERGSGGGGYGGAKIR